MNKNFNWLLLIAAFGLLLAGCTEPVVNTNEIEAALSLSPHTWKTSAESGETLPPESCGEPQAVTLYAGQDIPTGTVTIANDETNLYVTYSTSGGWMITEAHLAVATALAEIPQTNTGNPIPGRFPYTGKYTDPVALVTFTIKLSSWNPDTDLFVAAHAAVVLFDGNGAEMQTETAWADGFDFPGGNWATYFIYTVQSCANKPPDLAWQFRTQTQGGWGAPAHGGNPGSYRDDHFGQAFPSGLAIGDTAPAEDPDGFTVLFTSAQAVEGFLPGKGQPGVLTADITDPTDTSAGVLAGQVAALSLNVRFDLVDPDFSASLVHLEDLEVADPSSSCYGWTVGEVLAEANRILGGMGSGLTPAQINECVSRINENFVDGTIDEGFLKLPSP